MDESDQWPALSDTLGGRSTVTGLPAGSQVAHPLSKKLPLALLHEGVAEVSGIYNGKQVTRFTMVEMVGNWRA